MFNFTLAVPDNVYLYSDGIECIVVAWRGANIFPFIHCTITSTPYQPGQYTFLQKIRIHIRCIETKLLAKYGFFFCNNVERFVKRVRRIHFINCKLYLLIITLTQYRINISTIVQTEV